MGRPGGVAADLCEERVDRRDRAALLRAGEEAEETRFAELLAARVLGLALPLAGMLAATPWAESVWQRIRPGPPDAVSIKLQSEELETILGTLSHRERKVLELRFGLRGEEPRTLEEVGQAFGVTRERIRQIEAKTLNKLKAFRDTQRLREFLD